MGIEGLSAVLKKYGVTARPCSLKSFRGKSVAIDAAATLMTHLATSHAAVVETLSLSSLVRGEQAHGMARTEIANACIERTLRLIHAFLFNGVCPVWVLDAAEPSPDMVDAKARTREKREKDRRRVSDELDALRAELKDFAEREGWNALDQLLDVHVSVDAFIARCAQPVSGGDLLDLPSQGQPMVVKARRFKNLCGRSFGRFSAHENRVLTDLLGALGVTVLESPDEGERLACVLARRGLVDAVLSHDSDTVAHGASLSIRAINVPPGATSFLGGAQCEVLHLDDVRANVPNCADQARLVDLCILLGTDFNVHPPGVGPVKAVALHQAGGPGVLSAAVQAELRADWCRAYFLEDPADLELTRADLWPTPDFLKDDALWASQGSWSWVRTQVGPDLAKCCGVLKTEAVKNAT